MEHLVFRPQEFTVSKDSLWISRLLLLIYAQKPEDRVKVASGTLKTWKVWVLGAGIYGEGTIRPILEKVSPHFN